MKVIDPGHTYALDSLDGAPPFTLSFVKRVGDLYPGNAGEPHGGPTTQEVIRALIDRTKYVDQQALMLKYPGWEDDHRYNDNVIEDLRQCLLNLESRAARTRGEWDKLGAALRYEFKYVDIEAIPTCSTCGHIMCGRHQ